MILGIGTDIAKVSRFEKWVKNQSMIERFFNEKERSSASSQAALCEHYAARFAVKEAFSKALGTGLSGFELKDVYITNNDSGAPVLNVQGKALSYIRKHFGECNFFVSISHEKEFAIAFVILEKKQ